MAGEGVVLAGGNDALLEEGVVLAVNDVVIVGEIGALATLEVADAAEVDGPVSSEEPVWAHPTSTTRLVRPRNTTTPQ